MSDALLIAILGFLMTGPIAAVGTTIYLDQYREKQRVKREAAKEARNAKEKEAADAESKRKTQEAAEETINALVDEYGLRGIKEAIDFQTTATGQIRELQEAGTQRQQAFDDLMKKYEQLEHLADDLSTKFDDQSQRLVQALEEGERKDGLIAERDSTILTLTAERDLYLARAVAAETERDAANARANAAERERDSCNTARMTAEAERDTARAERDLARADAEKWKTQLELKRHDTGPLADIPITKET